MNPVVVVTALVGVAAVAWLLKSRIVIAAKVTTSDIPRVFEKLKTSGKNGSFAQFCFGSPVDKSGDNAVNVQFSIEQERIGFDWCLLCPLNIRDKQKFIQLARRLGHQFAELEMNGVKYIRVEDGDLPKLCAASIRDLYAVPADTPLELISSGFTWP